MARQNCSFLCPVLKQHVEMQAKLGDWNLLSEVNGCSGSEICGVTNKAAGQAQFEWKRCPVLRSHLALPVSLDAPPPAIRAGL